MPFLQANRVSCKPRSFLQTFLQTLSAFLQVSSLLSNPTSVEAFISKGFEHFDKDHSGFIESNEIIACVDKVLHLAGIDRPQHTHIESVFAKVAGSDKRLDKGEFSRLLHLLLDRLQKSPKPAAPMAM
jgi:Ca2+-binding EF-hand superfamily protein